MGKHQIIELRTDDEELDAFWRCRCSEVSTGYVDLNEARLAAAEHQLPPNIQREIEECGHLPQDVESWRADVARAADDEADANPTCWQWYLRTAPLSRVPHSDHWE